jgi:hypothetical protein
MRVEATYDRAKEERRKDGREKTAFRQLHRI